MYCKFAVLLSCLLISSCAVLQKFNRPQPKPPVTEEERALGIKEYEDFVEPISRLTVVFKRTYQFYFDECAFTDLRSEGIISTWRGRNEPLIQKITLAKYLAY